MTAAPRPVLTDHSKLAGMIPMTRRWFDCGNGYGVSVATDDVSGWHQVAAGAWLGRCPGRLTRMFRRVAVMSDVGERFHTRDWDEVLGVVRHVAGLPPYEVEPAGPMLPPCRCEWCPAGTP